MALRPLFKLFGIPGRQPVFPGVGLPQLLTLLDTASFPADRFGLGSFLAFQAVFNTALTRSQSLVLNPATFPRGTVFNWSWPVDADTSVKAWNAVDYGNYLNTEVPTPIASSRISALDTLKVRTGWTYTMPADSANLTLDFFLYTTSSSTADKMAAEVQVYYHTPDSSKAFVDSVTNLGTYTSPAIDGTPAITWRVGRQASNSFGTPYYLFYPADQSDKLAITFDVKAALNWLRGTNPTTGQVYLTGGEYFNGLGVGVEAIRKAGTATLTDLGVTYQVAVLPSDLSRFVAFGDSETAGFLGGGVSYPSLLASAIGQAGDIDVTNAGQSGYTSTEIAITAGGIDPVLGAFTLPASGTAIVVTITAPTASFRTDAYAVWDGVLTLPGGATYAGRLMHDNAGNTTFAAFSPPASPIAVAAGATFHCTRYDSPTYRGAVALIAIGRNNVTSPSVVLRDVAAIVSRLTAARTGYLVMAVVNSAAETSGTSGYNQVMAINAALASAYGDRFLDQRSFIKSSGLAFNGLTPTSQDTSAIAADTLPPQLYAYDQFHPNSYGYIAWAEAVRQKLAALGWLLNFGGAIPKPTGFEYPSTATQLFTDPSFELGTAQYALRQAAGYGSASRVAGAARTGSQGLRIAFTGAGTGAALDIYKGSLDASLSYSTSIWVRPSKTVSLGLAFLIYGDTYGGSFAGGIYGTLVSCPANTWTQIPLSSGPTGFTGSVLAVSLYNDGQSWASGDTLDIDDLAVVRGSALPSASPAAITLADLSAPAGTVGTAYSGTVTGKTAGSTLALSGPGAAGLSVSGATIAGTPTTAGAVNIVETLAGATNSPKTTTGAFTVAAASSNLIPSAAANDVTNSFWTKGGINLGTTTATSLREDTSNGVHGITSTLISKAAAQKSYLLTVDVDTALGRSWAFIQIANADFSGGAQAYFDAGNNAIGFTQSSGSFTLGTPTVTTVSGKKRLTFPFTAGVTGTTSKDNSLYLIFRMASGNFGQSYQGVAGNGMNVSAFSLIEQ